MFGPVNPSPRLRRLFTFECPPDILINRSRPPVHEATGGHAVRTIYGLQYFRGINADKYNFKCSFTCHGGTSRPLDSILPFHRPRFCGKIAPDGIFKLPTATLSRGHRARWRPFTLSNGRGCSRGEVIGRSNGAMSDSIFVNPHIIPYFCVKCQNQ